jgi:hypothetical protein
VQRPSVLPRRRPRRAPRLAAQPGVAGARHVARVCVKDCGVISVPEVTQRRITSGDQSVILATDGVAFVPACLPFAKTHTRLFYTYGGTCGA